MSIAVSILEMAEEEAGRQGAARVTAVHLKLGPLSGVVREALLSAYDLARESAPPALTGSELRIEATPLRANCPTCRRVVAIVSVQHQCCADCGTPTPDVVSGNELEVFALEFL
ncbi:MAG TPA: hydrogenase maturation nickel metallochaperone HypA [Fimbriiglobus sp.]